MKLANFLLNNKQEHNGHKQLTLPRMSHKKMLKLLRQLEACAPGYGFTWHVWSDGSSSIFQDRYWKPGEHPMAHNNLGHTDRLIASFE